MMFRTDRKGKRRKAMSGQFKYMNEKCPVCHKTFAETDDVVVCPDCGAPHHRDCWNEVQHCAYEHKHGEGFHWESSLEKHRKEMEEQARAEYEKNAGVPEEPVLDYGSDIGMVFQTMNEEEEIEGVRLRDYAEFMGINAVYYLPIFKKLARGERIITVNFLAGLLAPYHQLFYRMNFVGVLITAIMFVFAVPARLSLMFDPNEISTILANIGLSYDILDQFQNISLWFSFALMIIMALFNDKLYFRFVVKKIKAIRAKSTGGQEYFTALAEAGRPSFKNIMFIFFGTLIIFSGILFAAAKILAR